MKNLKINWQLILTAGLVLAVVVIVSIIGYFSSQSKISQNYQSEEVVESSIGESQPTNQPTGTQPVSTNQTLVEQPLPDKKLLKMDFASQAPYGDWSEPYENACEEASIITVEHFLKQFSLSKEEMKQEIDASVAWQIRNWGGHKDLDADKTLELAEGNFKLSGEVITVSSANDLKKQLAQNHPIIVPTAGRKLGNPNFRGAGPEYHMLVVKGYDDEQGVFITNDVGTRKGESYIYKFDVLMNAISGPHEDMVKKVLILE
jgi:hypothetical protein